MSESALGRPSTYTPELVDRILDALRGGMLLRELARQEWAPDQSTMWRWSEKHDEFRIALAQARKAGAARLAEECLPLVDGVDPDSEHGSARVSKAREQVGLRKWLASCLDRDTYGERAPEVKVAVQSNVIVALSKLGGRVDGE